MTGLATTSAAFSGFVFLGGPGLAYRLGVGSLMICLPLGFTSVLLCWSLGKRLRLLAAVREVFTVADVVEARFASRRAAGLAAVAVAFGTIGYLGAQVQALGILLESVFHTRAILGAWSLPGAMAVGLAVLLLYSALGGMVAGVYTDLLQGAIMMVAAIAVFWRALAATGGLSSIARAIVASPSFGAGFLQPFGRAPAGMVLGFFLVFSVGVLGQPHMLHKLFMLDDPAKLRWLPLVVAVSQSLCILIWLGLGLAVPALVAMGRLAPLTEPDAATPIFLLGFTSPLLAGIVLAGALAAIMSTADSLVNVGAAALVRDLPRALGRPVRDELAWGGARSSASASSRRSSPGAMAT